MSVTSDGKQRGLCVATRCTTIDELIGKFAPYCDGMSLFTITTSLREVGSEAPFAILLADKTVVMRGWCVVFDAWSTSKNPYGRPGMRLGLHRLTKASRELFDRMNALRESQRASGRPLRLGTQPIALEMHTPTAIGMPPIARPPQAVTIDDKHARTSIGMPPLARTPQPRRRPASIQIPPRDETPAENAAIVSERATHDSTERMVAPPLAAFAFGTVTMEAIQKPSPPPVVAIPPKAAVPVQTRFPRGSDRIEQRTPGSDLILPANPLTELTDSSLDGFVDCHLYEELQPQGEAAAPFVPLAPEAPAPAVPTVPPVPPVPAAPWPMPDWRRIAIVAGAALLAAILTSVTVTRLAPTTASAARPAALAAP